jgi:hypothetical protein
MLRRSLYEEIIYYIYFYLPHKDSLKTVKESELCIPFTYRLQSLGWDSSLFSDNQIFLVLAFVAFSFTI